MNRPARFALASLPALVAIASSAHAQEQPPPLPPATAQQPPPGYAPPPPGYGQPPPGYYPPPGYPPYGQPPRDTRPVKLDYEDGDPIPQGYHLRTKVRGGLIGGGAGMLGGFWLLSIIVGAIANEGHKFTDGEEPWTPMYIPVVGPFVTMGTAARDLSGAGSALLAIDGIVQVGGLAMIILGAVLPKKELIRDELGKPALTIGPGVAGNGAGLVGSF